MMLWSPQDGTFLSCSDARPRSQRGFDPIARHVANGPWTGLASPAHAAGRRIVLARASSNAAGRISASEGVRATVMPDEPAGALAALLPATASWDDLARALAERRRSVLAEPEPMRDWVALRPASFGAARFDEARQVLSWPLADGAGRTIHAELAFGPMTRHAIARIEAFDPGANDRGLLVVARALSGSMPIVVEPLSLVGEHGVDALFFDAAPAAASHGARALRAVREWLAPAPSVEPSVDGTPIALRELRRALRLQAERGVPSGQAATWQAEVSRLAERAAASGLPAFGTLAQDGVRAGELLLRLDLLRLQVERTLGVAEESA
jgi:hypothetical protein